MNPPPMLPSIELWPLVARLANDSFSSRWAVLGVPSDQIETTAAQVSEQLASLLDAPIKLVRLDSAQSLLDAVQAHPDHALVLVDVDGLSPVAWRNIDANRSRLARDLPALIVLEETRVPTMLEHAPNLWSWIAGSAWRGVADRGLSDEQRALRLTALREHFGFSDEELVLRAEAGTLPAEPDIAEWLVLIGKGHLIGR